MGEIPSKAAELRLLCHALRERSVLFFLCAEGARRKGSPDLIVGGAGLPVAVWVRRSDNTAPLSPAQQTQLDKFVAVGWNTMISFGAAEALRDLQRRGSLAGRMGDVHAFAPTSQCAY